MPVNGRDRIVTVLYEDNEAVEIYVRDFGKEQIVGNIYLGHVTKAASSGFFVNFDGVNEGFLPIRKAGGAVFKTVKKNAEIRPGDELLVMADTEGVKSKLTGLTCELSMTGKNFVVCSGFRGLRFSSKLSGEEKERVRRVLGAADRCETGFIVRTCAAEVSEEELRMEAEGLSGRIKDIMSFGVSRPYGACLYKAGGIWMDKLKGLQLGRGDKVITDIEEIYQEIKTYLSDTQDTGAGMLENVCLYGDKMVSLYRLNNLSALIDSALSEKVWLRSGASIVIQQTEAFVCIDVNSSKASSGRKTSEEFFNINREAAEEIAKQIRLRQLSGIILIDFINMQSKELENRLISEFSAFVRNDPVKVNIVDITPLGIMESTRRKKSRSLSEQIFCLTKA